jgi:hypothetical protein
MMPPPPWHVEDLERNDPKQKATEVCCWHIGDGFVYVEFDKRGKILSRMLFHEQTITEKMRRWVRQNIGL